MQSASINAHQSVKTLIKGLRQDNFEYRKFVPGVSLQRTLTKDIIRTALRESGISFHLQNEIAARIVRSGRSIFAILILTDSGADILKFIEADELQDVKLPFSIEVLRNEIKLSSPTEFNETQWEFAVPTFVRGTLNRRLRSKTVLPFISKQDEGRGAFGKVFRLQLHLDHQQPQHSGVIFPQEKEMDHASDHRVELDNLAILNHLKHPNIVELLTSYTYQGKHSLLFPRANHGTMFQLFRTERRATGFSSNSTLFIALAGLASAIDHVHTFFERKLDLHFIGCHHDLKPHNVLVSGTKFILADFGLSRFKSVTEDSETRFRMGNGDYLAPECEDDARTFEPLRVRRSSDVWSFGCILAEAATYILHGKDAVEDFRSRRLLRVRNFNLYRFHHGPEKPSPAVVEWLSELEKSSDQSCMGLITLSRRMLRVSPLERPKASEVTLALRLIAIEDVATEVDRLFKAWITTDGLSDVFIEHTRFEAWRYALGVIDSLLGENFWSTPCDDQEVRFEDILDCLTSMRGVLGSQDFHEEVEQALSSQTTLRSLNDRLIELLSGKQQERARDYFRICMVSTENVDSSQPLYLDREIRLSQALKHMSTFTMNNPNGETSGKLVDSRMVSIYGSCGHHSIGHLIPDVGYKSQVLIEWRRYGDHSVDETTNRRRFTRLNSIVQRLSTENPEAMRTLECIGFFHDEHGYRFGILYRTPSSASPPRTLRQWMATAPQKRQWPILDDKFRLAHMLAKAVLEIHLVGWVHKSLTASNIVFFPPDSQSTTAQNRDESFLSRHPFVIGFNHSRPDDPDEPTEGIPDSADLAAQHPDYCHDTRRRYMARYDYYSLGIILLEIGLWMPIKEILGLGKAYDHAKYGEKLRRKMLHLAEYMGREYRAAVTACIEGDFAEEEERTAGGTESGTRKLLVEFETKVLSRLRGRCDAF